MYVCDSMSNVHVCTCTCICTLYMYMYMYIDMYIVHYGMEVVRILYRVIDDGAACLS